MTLFFWIVLFFLERKDTDLLKGGFSVFDCVIRGDFSVFDCVIVSFFTLMFSIVEIFHEVESVVLRCSDVTTVRLSLVYVLMRPNWLVSVSHCRTHSSSGRGPGCRLVWVVFILPVTATGVPSGVCSFTKWTGNSTLRVPLVDFIRKN